MSYLWYIQRRFVGTLCQLRKLADWGGGVPQYQPATEHVVETKENKTVSKPSISISPKIIAIAVVAVIVVAAIAVIALSGDDKNDDKDSKATISLRNEYRIWDTLTYKGDDSSVETYVITAISDNNYTVTTSLEEDDSIFSLNYVFTKSEVDQLFSTNFELSKMTKTGTVTRDTEYGKMDLERYTYADSEGNSYVYDVVPGTSIYMFEKKTDTNGKTVDETTVSTAFLIDGKDQSVSVPTINSLIVRDEIYTEDNWVCASVSSTDMFSSNPTVGLKVVSEVVTEISGDNYTIAEFTFNRDGETSIDSLTLTLTKSSLLSNWKLDRYKDHSPTYIGKEIIRTNYGYITCDKYSYTDAGNTFYVYIDHDSSSLMAATVKVTTTTVAGTTTTFTSYCFISSTYNSSN